MPLLLICLVALSIVLIAGILVSDWFEKRRQRAFFQSRDFLNASEPGPSQPLPRFWKGRRIIFALALVVAVALYHRKLGVDARTVPSSSTSASRSHPDATMLAEFAQDVAITLALPEEPMNLEKVTYRLDQQPAPEISDGNPNPNSLAREDAQSEGSAELFEQAAENQTVMESFPKSDPFGSYPSSRAEISIDAFKPMQRGAF